MKQMLLDIIKEIEPTERLISVAEMARWIGCYRERLIKAYPPTHQGTVMLRYLPSEEEAARLAVANYQKPKSEYLSQHEVCEYAGVSWTAFRYRLDHGDLPCQPETRNGSQYCYTQEQAEQIKHFFENPPPSRKKGWRKGVKRGKPV